MNIIIETQLPVKFAKEYTCIDSTSHYCAQKSMKIRTASRISVEPILVAQKTNT